MLFEFKPTSKVNEEHLGEQKREVGPLSLMMMVCKA